MSQLIRVILIIISAVASSTAIARDCASSDDVVVNRVSEILNISITQLVLEKKFSEQNPAGDALDIVEIIMAIEDSLNIEINDRELDTRIGSKSITDLPHKLTIKTLQQFTNDTCVRA
jgi:acyl carrier protein